MDEIATAELRVQAERYRRLKQGTGDARTLAALNSLADECDAKADAIDESASETSSKTQTPNE